MSDKVDIEKLKQLLKDITLLYVEDNVGLLEKGSRLFKKLFAEVYQAKNGREGFEFFKKYHPDIIITDIQMPDVDGLEMSKLIRKIDKNIKIIITTAYDDKDYLLKTIDIGVVSYLKKPISIDILTKLLSEVAQDIVDEKNKNIFNDYLYHIVNDQDNLIFMINKENVVLANDYSLDFFGLNNLNEFREHFKGFGSLLLPHDTFLYEHDDIHYLEELKNNQGKHYNVKMIDKNNKLHHLLLKLSKIEEKENFYLLSLNDITELNLLGLFDKKSLDHDKALKNEQSILNLLMAAKESQAEIKMHNYYKGLSVTNSAMVVDVSKEKVVLKTVYSQQKAIAFEKKVILSSALFPFDIESTDLKVINFQQKSVEITHCTMIKNTPTMRQNVTLDTEPNHSIALFYNKNKFDAGMHIINLSINSMRLSLNFLPAGLKEEDSVKIEIVLNKDVKPIIHHTDAVVYKIIKLKSSFELVLTFNTDNGINKTLVDYIATRQMKLIREFKGLQYEK